MSKLLTANRLTALTTWLAGLSGLILGAVGTLPHAWQNTASMVAGLLVQAVTAIKFLEGAQRSEVLAGGSPSPVTPATVAATAPPAAAATPSQADQIAQAAKLPDPPPA